MLIYINIPYIIDLPKDLTKLGYKTIIYFSHIPPSRFHIKNTIDNIAKNIILIFINMLSKYNYDSWINNEDNDNDILPSDEYEFYIYLKNDYIIELKSSINEQLINMCNIIDIILGDREDDIKTSIDDRELIDDDD